MCVYDIPAMEPFFPMWIFSGIWAGVFWWKGERMLNCLAVGGGFVNWLVKNEKKTPLYYKGPRYGFKDRTQDV